MASGWAGDQAQSLNWPVKTVVATQGQKVKQGDVLATADSSDAQVALLSAQANLSAAQSRLTNDQADSKTPSSTILQDQAQVASAQASYDHAKAAASQDQLVAPADGLVIAVNILPGVNAGHHLGHRLGCERARRGGLDSTRAHIGDEWLLLICRRRFAEQRRGLRRPGHAHEPARDGSGWDDCDRHDHHRLFH